MEKLQDKINSYIAKHWNAKQITPEIGLEHWLFIQQISADLISQLFDLDEYQKRVTDWNRKNFGQHYQTGYRLLLGMMEELGELSHSHLKQEQKIRMNEDHEANKQDAIGDMVVFLLKYCDSQGYQLTKILEDVWGEIKDRDWKKNNIDGKAG